MSRRAQLLLLIAIAGLTLLATLWTGIRKPHDKTSFAPTTYSSSPHGTRAFFLTLEKLGYQPRRWRLEWSRLRGETGLLLYAPSDPLTAAGQYRPLSATAVREVHDWISRGNSLVYFLSAAERERGQSPLLDALGISLALEPLAPDQQRAQNLRQFLPTRLEREADRILPVPWAAGVRRLSLELAPGFRASRGHAVALAETPGFAHVQFVPHGNGRVYLFSSASVMDNQFLARADNLRFLLNLLDREGGKGRAVLFDEFHHGFSSEFGATDFGRLSVVRYVGLQALLMGLLFLASSWQRFGSPRPLARGSRRSLREYTQSLGNLYFRARAHREVLSYLYQQLRLSLLSRYNLPPTTTNEMLEEQLRIQRGAAEAWREVASDCERLLGSGRVGNRDLVVVARKMDRFRELIA